MGCLLTRCVYFESVIHDTDDDILEDICDIGDDGDINIGAESFLLSGNAVNLSETLSQIFNLCGFQDHKKC